MANSQRYYGIEQNLQSVIKSLGFEKISKARTSGGYLLLYKKNNIKIKISGWNGGMSLQIFMLTNAGGYKCVDLGEMGLYRNFNDQDLTNVLTKLIALPVPAITERGKKPKKDSRPKHLEFKNDEIVYNDTEKGADSGRDNVVIKAAYCGIGSFGPRNIIDDAQDPDAKPYFIIDVYLAAASQWPVRMMRILTDCKIYYKITGRHFKQGYKQCASIPNIQLHKSDLVLIKAAIAKYAGTIDE